jgi:two-component system heavy metal sensor histidine kinase CusS
MRILLSGSGQSVLGSSGPDSNEATVRSGTFPVAEDAGHAEDEPRPSSEIDTHPARDESLQRFKDDTVATLIHELSGPLAAMMMNLDFALAELPDHEDTRDTRSALAESRAAGSMLFRAIANLLDIARSDDSRLVPKRTVVDIHGLFARAIKEFAAEVSALEITIDIEVTIDQPFEADADMLARVVASLFECALRHTDMGGRIVLAARPGAGSTTVLAVSHQGRPLSSEVRSIAFDKNVRVASSQVLSRGLGLYFCRLAAEAHGGRMQLAAGAGGGNSFRIELPSP